MAMTSAAPMIEAWTPSRILRGLDCGVAAPASTRTSPRVANTAERFIVVLRSGDGANQAAVGIIAQTRERVCLVGPQDLVDLVIVVADLLERPHQEPADRLLHLPAVSPEPVGHGSELPLQLASIAGLLAHLAERRVGAGLALRERAFRQGPDGLAAQVAGADEQHAALGIEDDAAGGELEEDASPVGHAPMIPVRASVIPCRSTRDGSRRSARALSPRFHATPGAGSAPDVARRRHRRSARRPGGASRLHRRGAAGSRQEPYRDGARPLERRRLPADVPEALARPV